MEVKLETVHTGYSVSKINANFERIQHFINYYCVKRYNDKGDANEMWTDIIFDPLVDGGGGGGGGWTGVCTISADIMFAIDNTGSQNKIEYESLVKPAIVNMLQALITLSRDVTVGASVILDVPYLGQALTSSVATLQSFVTALPEPTGATNLGDAITIAKEELDLNGRVGVPGVIVILTDGSPNVPTTNAIWYAEQAAIAAKAAGYRVIVFGITGIDNTSQAGGGIG